MNESSKKKNARLFKFFSIVYNLINIYTFYWDTIREIVKRNYKEALIL